MLYLGRSGNFTKKESVSVFLVASSIPKGASRYQHWPARQQNFTSVFCDFVWSSVLYPGRLRVDTFHSCVFI